MQSKHRKKGENKKRKTSLQEGKRKSLLTLTGLLMEGLEQIVAVGKNADLVVVNGDPSVRIADIENVELVFRDGLGFDSARLLDSVKGKFGLY